MGLWGGFLEKIPKSMLLPRWKTIGQNCISLKPHLSHFLNTTYLPRWIVVRVKAITDDQHKGIIHDLDKDRHSINNNSLYLFSSSFSPSLPSFWVLSLPPIHPSIHLIYLFSSLFPFLPYLPSFSHPTLSSLWMYFSMFFTPCPHSLPLHRLTWKMVIELYLGNHYSPLSPA